MIKRLFLFAAAVSLLLPVLSFAEGKGTVSYNINGQAFSFKNATLEYHPNEGYLSIDCAKKEMVDHPGYGRSGCSGSVIRKVLQVIQIFMPATRLFISL
jgi:hypothetical protein